MKKSFKNLKNCVDCKWAIGYPFIGIDVAEYDENEAKIKCAHKRKGSVWRARTCRDFTRKKQPNYNRGGISGWINGLVTAIVEGITRGLSRNQ